MSPATTTAPATAPPTSQAIVEPFNAQARFGKANEPSILRVSSRSRDGFSTGEHRIVIGTPLQFVPRVLIELLEGDLDGGFAVSVGLVVYRSDGRTQDRASVLLAKWTYNREFRRALPNGRGRMEWRAPIEKSEAQIDRLLKSAAPPTAIITAGGYEVYALYALAAAVPLSTHEHRFRQHLSQLADLLGADRHDPNVGLETLRYPLPGSIVRTAQSERDAGTVRAVSVEPRNVYPVDDLLSRLQKQSAGAR